MGISSSSKSCCLLSLTLLFFSCFGNNLPSLNSTNSNLHNNLLYTLCANQTSNEFPTGSVHEILSSLFQELGVKSSHSKFYETSVGDEEIAISGLFQCRNDLSNEECHSCVNRIPEMSKSFCGRTVPARIHLSGCYLRYEADGPHVSSRLELQHKTCSESKAVSGGGGFEEARDGALASAEGGVVNGNGYCELSYEAMHVVAQCEGNLEGCDCGECVNYAVQVAQDECGESVSGEVYLDGCFVTYSYNGDIENPTNSNQGTGINTSSKLVAIVVGGAAALLFGFMLIYCLRSSRKKSDDW